MKYDQITLNLMPGHVYIKGLDGKYIACNIRMSRFLDLDSPEDIKGKTTLDLLGEENQALVDAVVEIDNKVISTGVPFHGPEKDGEFISLKEPIYDELRCIIGMVGISQPIPEGFFIEKQQSYIHSY